MHLSFKSICNTEHKGVIRLQDECFAKNYSSCLDFTRNYERTSGILSPVEHMVLTFVMLNICMHHTRVNLLYSSNCCKHAFSNIAENGVDPNQMAWSEAS